jgi:hypothetical protein
MVAMLIRLASHSFQFTIMSVCLACFLGSRDTILIILQHFNNESAHGSPIMSVCSRLLRSRDAILTILQPSEDSHSEDELWHKTSPDITALKAIINDHLNSPCLTEQPMNHGAYARVFLYTLQNGIQVVARVILPVRESLKTESEIAAMDMMRGMLIRRSNPSLLHS